MTGSGQFETSDPPDWISASSRVPTRTGRAASGPNCGHSGASLCPFAN